MHMLIIQFSSNNSPNIFDFCKMPLMKFVCDTVLLHNICMIAIFGVLQTNKKSSHAYQQFICIKYRKVRQMFNGQNVTREKQKKVIRFLGEIFRKESER